MITTVVFDLDDALYDEIDYCRSGFAAVAEFLTESPNTPAAESVFDSLWKQFTSGNRTRTFDTTLDELEISYDDNLIRRLVELYRNHVPQITLPADSENVLSELSGEYTLALLTDGFLPAQQLKVRALGIEHYFKCIMYTEQLGRQFWKPSPIGFEKLMETINVKPQNAAYVADNEKKDFIAPNELGFLTIQIIRPARIHTESSEESHAPAKHIIHKISQLPPLLQKA
ncbi:MAG: HAD family hydrolase [Planctomycetota bacterium]|jgi:putative hydrolase of the HAD superfamily